MLLTKLVQLNTPPATSDAVLYKVQRTLSSMVDRASLGLRGAQVTGLSWDLCFVVISHTVCCMECRKRCQPRQQTERYVSALMPADVCIAAAVRTPMGAFQGSLSGYSATDLGGFAIKGELSIYFLCCAISKLRVVMTAVSALHANSKC